MTVQHALDVIAGIDVGVPIVAMTYYNLVFRAGHRRAADRWRRRGSRAPSCPTSPSRSSGPGRTRPMRPGWRRCCWSPRPRRRPECGPLCARSRGFVYAVARMGVTGERSTLGGRGRPGRRTRPGLHRPAGLRGHRDLDPRAGRRGLPGRRRGGRRVGAGASPARRRRARGGGRARRRHAPGPGRRRLIPVGRRPGGPATRPGTRPTPAAPRLSWEA